MARPKQTKQEEIKAKVNLAMIYMDDGAWFSALVILIEAMNMVAKVARTRAIGNTIPGV